MEAGARCHRPSKVSAFFNTTQGVHLLHAIVKSVDPAAVILSMLYVIPGLLHTTAHAA